MFALNHNSIPRIRSYHDAENYFASEKKTRYCDENERELGGGRGSRIIRKVGNDYHFIYHSTTCVIHHANGDITVEGYPSRSTDTFVRALTPYNMEPRFTCAAGCVLWLTCPDLIDGQWSDTFVMRTGFNVSNPVRFVQKPAAEVWRPVDLAACRGFEIKTVDRAAAKAARAAWRLAEFETWWKAITAMKGRRAALQRAQERYGRKDNLQWQRPAWIKEQLLEATPSAYMQLLACCSIADGFNHAAHDDAVLNPVSQIDAIMKLVEHVHTRKRVPFLTSKAQMHSARSL